MLTTEDARDLIDQVFEEEALVLGGLVAVHPVDDQFVWRLMQNLAVIRRRVVRSAEDLGAVRTGRQPTGDATITPHPAIENFLKKLGSP